MKVSYLRVFTCREREDQLGVEEAEEEGGEAGVWWT